MCRDTLMTNDPEYHRLVISICGPAGAGKSRLAKAVVTGLGDDRAVRIPGDYFLQPALEPLASFLTKPIAYDWPLLAMILTQPNGTALTTPEFDFERFARLAASGGQPFVMRPLVLLDTMHPYPEADLTILLTAPEDLRRARIAARDIEWGTDVIGRWGQLEASRRYLENLPFRHDLELAGEHDPAESAAKIIARLPISHHR